MQANHYNLGSNRREETQLPMQNQLVDDEEFVTQSLGSSHTVAEQVHCSDNSSSTSDSDLDLKELLQYSDKDFQVSSPCSFRSGCDARSAKAGQSCGRPVSVVVEVSQQEIDLNIYKWLYI